MGWGHDKAVFGRLIDHRDAVCTHWLPVFFMAQEEDAIKGCGYQDCRCLTNRVHIFVRLQRHLGSQHCAWSRLGLPPIAITKRDATGDRGLSHTDHQLPVTTAWWGDGIEHRARTADYL